MAGGFFGWYCGGRAEVHHYSADSTGPGSWSSIFFLGGWKARAGMRIALGGLKSAPQAIDGVAFHPLFGQEMQYQVEQVPDDPDQQVVRTIQLMARYANEDASSPVIQQEAQDIAYQCHTDLERVREIWWRVQRRVQFQRDEITAQPLAGISGTWGGSPIVEILIRPRDMAGMRARVGDCDDYAMYAASLMTALGIPSAFVTVAGDSSAPDQFTHVYVAAYPDGERVAVDASHGPECGWEAPLPGARKREWPLGDVMKNCPVSGLPLLVLIGGLAAAAWSMWGTGR